MELDGRIPVDIDCLVMHLIYTLFDIYPVLERVLQLDKADYKHGVGVIT